MKSLWETIMVLLNKGIVVEGAIILNYGLKSSKLISKIDEDKISVFNFIDETEDEFTIEEFKESNTGKAILKGAFKIDYVEQSA